MSFSGQGGAIGLLSIGLGEIGSADDGNYFAMGIRRYLGDFALANSLYAGAQVTIYTVDPASLQPTTTLAPIYADLTSSSLLGNPQQLDGEGKWQQPVYVDQPIVMLIGNAAVEDHQTGVNAGEGAYRGDWASGVLYLTGDTIRDGTAGGNTSNVYYCADPHTSGNFATDLGNGLWQIYVSAAALTGGVASAAVAAAIAAVSGAGYLQGNQNITVSGDATGGGATSIPITLTPTGVTPGTYTQVTVDAKGRVTGGSTSIAALDGKDVIRNGGFDLWQRGTTFTNVSGYFADGWQTYGDGSGATISIAQAQVTDQIVLDEGWSHWLHLSQTVAGSGGTFRQILHRIEGVRTFAGCTVMLEFWGKAITAPDNFNVSFAQSCGSGGSPSTGWIGGGQACTFVATPQKFGIQVTLPSIIGKTLGTNGDDWIEIVFNLPVNTTQDFYLTGVKMRHASVVGLSGPSRSPQEELAICQRYYEVGSHFLSGYNTAGAGASAMCNYAVAKRAVPTIVLTPGASNNVTSQSVGGTTVNGFEHIDTVTATGTFYGHCTWTASAEL